MDISEHDLIKLYLEQSYSSCKTWVNVCLGEVDDWKYEKMYRVTRRRADAIVKSGDKILIIEAKLKPDPGAIGQLMLYEKLFRKTPKFSEFSDFPVRRVLLTTALDRDLREVCASHLIGYKIFVPD